MNKSLMTVSEYNKLCRKAKRKNAKYGNIKKGWMELFNGKQEDYRFYARSGYEMSFARYLKFLAWHDTNLHWLHENITLEFEGVRRGCVVWIPDFTLYRDKELLSIYEVKGRFEGKDATKIRRIKKYHPELFDKLVYVTVQSNFNKVIKLGVKSLIEINDLRRRFNI